MYKLSFALLAGIGIAMSSVGGDLPENVTARLGPDLNPTAEKAAPEVQLAAVQTPLNADAPAAPEVSRGYSREMLSFSAPANFERTDPIPVSLNDDVSASTKSLSADLDIRIVTGNSVNVRQGPGTGYSVVGQVGRNEQVSVYQDEGTGWVKLISLETGVEGFLYDKFLTPQGSVDG